MQNIRCEKMIRAMEKKATGTDGTLVWSVAAIFNEVAKGGLTVDPSGSFVHSLTQSFMVVGPSRCQLLPLAHINL